MKIIAFFFALVFSVPIVGSSSLETIPPLIQADLNKDLKDLWQGWALMLEGGLHFKTLPDADFSHVKTKLGHNKDFWGEMGGLAGIGFKYGRTFFTHGYWDIRTLWTFFYPDVRLKGDEAQVTLSSIPIIGQYIGLGSAPGYITMLLPILYFDIGYTTEKGYLFTLGSVYLWGLSPAFAVPFDEHWSLEFRGTLFLDRIFFAQGYHSLLGSATLSYKF